MFQNCKEATKYQHHVSMFFILCTWLYLLNFEGVVVNLTDNSFNISELQMRFSPNSPEIHHYNARSIVHQFISSNSLRNSGRKFESNHRSCINQCLQIDVIKKSNLETMGYYDTLTDAGIVRKQCSLLPYPPVTTEQLKRKKNYYNGSNFITEWTTYCTSKETNVFHF
jgi:hypothetical protein